MIELNLLEKKEPIKLPTVMGIDLNIISIPMLAFSVVFWYLPGYIVRSYYEGAGAEETKAIEELKAKNEKLKLEISKNGAIKETLKAYQTQVEKLKARSNQVDEILKLRTNPKKILEKIARSIPDDIWFDFLKINDKNEITISGGAYNSRSLGEFITIINDSPFFAGSITPTKQENKQEQLDGVLSSFDVFELRGQIKSYDMRAK